MNKLLYIILIGITIKIDRPLLPDSYIIWYKLHSYIMVTPYKLPCLFWLITAEFF